MSMEDLVSKYVACAEQVFAEIKVTEVCVNVEADQVLEVLNSAKAYLQDAKYYRSKRRLDVSLTSIAYCEGLLDGLRMLGMVRFEWPIAPEKRKG